MKTKVKTIHIIKAKVTEEELKLNERLMKISDMNIK